MPDLLQVQDLRARDDAADMLHGMEFEVGAGELVSFGERKWRRQDHDAARHYRDHRAAHRLCPLRRPRVDPTQLQPGSPIWTIGGRSRFSSTLRPATYSPFDIGLRGERLGSQTGGELRFGITSAFGRCRTERR
jgi:hypothetical protein